jgi:Arc/MetJ family transcription regulator
MECTLTIDERLLDEAREALGTTSVQDTVEAGLRAAIERRRGEKFIAQLADINFDMTDEDLREMRRLDVERMKRAEMPAE